MNETRGDKPEKDNNENGSGRKGWFEKPDERQKLRTEDTKLNSGKDRPSDHPGELKIQKEVSDDHRSIKGDSLIALSGINIAI